MTRPLSTWAIALVGIENAAALTVTQGQISAVVWLGSYPECVNLAAAFEKVGCVAAHTIEPKASP